MSHQLVLITSLPFVHTARRSYRLSDDDDDDEDEDDDDSRCMGYGRNSPRAF